MTPNLQKLSSDHIEMVHQFILDEFLPDEPVTSNLCKHQLVLKLLKKEFVVKTIKSGHSFGAFDPEDGTLLGVKLGYVMQKEHIEKLPKTDWISILPSCLVPKSLLEIHHFMRFLQEFQYTEELAFDQCPNNNNMIFDGAILAVAKKARGQAIGDKLVKHAINHATEFGCSHFHCCTTGIFSQKIMKNNGFDIVFEKPYQEFKDKHGNQLIKHDLHKTCQINVLKL